MKAIIAGLPIALLRISLFESIGNLKFVNKILLNVNRYRDIVVSNDSPDTEMR